MKPFAASLLSLALAACGDTTAPANTVLAPGPRTDVAELDAAAITPALRELVAATVPDMRIAEAERKERDGRVYFDVEGTRPDGSEVEIDVLEENGALRAVEIQRDVAWSTVPPAVSAAARAPFAPARVIESRQVDDGSTVYELFAPGRDDEPAIEVRWQAGRATVLAERNPH